MLQRKVLARMVLWKSSSSPFPARLTSDGRLLDRHNLYRRAFRCLIQADIALPAFSVEAPVVNHGATVENAVAQELTAHGYNLYYFNSKKHGEVDFVIEDADGRVMPIEVKSGKDYRRHRAMNKILDISDYRLDTGYLLAPGNIERQGKVLYLPTYMASLLNFDS